MKKTKLSVLIVMICLLMFNSCVLNGCVSRKSNSSETAKETYTQLIKALEEKDKSALKALFVEDVTKIDGFDKNALELMEMFEGDISTFESYPACQVSSDINYGFYKTEIMSRFTIFVDYNQYYVAFKQKVDNIPFSNNSGVLSFYIIKAEEWKDNSLYSGDGKWTEGININKQ